MATRNGWALPEKRPFKTIENTWIPMPDATQLAVRLWLPEEADATPVPVVMEYLPYRKDDGTLVRDAPTGRYLAEHGIAFARVDIRGTGDSKGGLLLGEYMPHEQLDGVAAIRWLSKQTWCNGAVGMRGKSWGGFNALQIAALAPPELKAIMPMLFADNRYTDDSHYVGGALGLINFEWGTMFQNVLTGPPDPQKFGAQWKEEWLKRLRGMPAVLAEWLHHQRFDAYWQRQSVGLDYRRIKCPVYCVGGWEDGYNNSIPRALTELTVPRKGLIGPWAHLFPPDGSPGPALDWKFEEVRWWEQWLKGVDTGIMAEPMLRFYMPDCKAAEVFPNDTPGHWAAEDVWPTPRIESMLFYLNSGTLSAAAEPSRTIRYKTHKVVGLQRMQWVPFTMLNDLAKEQSPDDIISVVFDSAPLDADLEIFGNPLAKLAVSADVPVAKLAVRLTEVTTEGKSWQVTYGLLNLTHRASHENPTELVPGKFYTIEVPLNLIAHRFKKGNRIRVSLSESLWPLVWPSPQQVTLTLMTGVSSLTLPVRPPRQPESPFTIPVLHGSPGPAEKDAGTVTVAGPDPAGWIIIDRIWPDTISLLEETGTVVSSGWRNWRMELREGQPNSCRWQGDFLHRYERAGWGANLLVAHFDLSSTAEAFQLKESIRATLDGTVLFERSWDNNIARDLM
ncbi:MAG: CocE/NonD family hydrolase [Steroidobacteraceae bacterium]